MSGRLKKTGSTSSSRSAPRRSGGSLSRLWKMERNGKRLMTWPSSSSPRWIDRNDPQNVEVYRFDAEVVRNRFDASYAARDRRRAEAARRFRDVGESRRRQPGYPVQRRRWARDGVSAGRHIPARRADRGDCGRTGRCAGRTAQQSALPSRRSRRRLPMSSALARKQIATLAGVSMEAVKLDCRIES